MFCVFKVFFSERLGYYPGGMERRGNRDQTRQRIGHPGEGIPENCRTGQDVSGYISRAPGCIRGGNRNDTKGEFQQKNHACHAF